MSNRLSTFIFLVSGSLGAVGCASGSGVDFAKQQQNFSQTLQNTAQKEQRAQVDDQDKTTLLENLVHAETPGIKKAEPALRASLQSMSAALTKMKDQRKEMQAANSDLASLSYNRSTLTSSDPGYERAKEATARFQTAYSASEAASSEFGKASTDFSDLIESKKLYYDFTPAEFHKRIQANLHSAQEESRAMQKTLNTSHDELENHTNPALHDVREASLSEMQRLAQEYTDHAQKYSQLSRDMNAITAANPHVNNLDPNWAQVHKLESQLTSLVSELGDLHSKFDKASDKFRAPLGGTGR